MSYRIAGIDVHKKMLAVVVSDVEIESEFQFERRMFASNPDQLRLLSNGCNSRKPRKSSWNPRRNIGGRSGKQWNGTGNRYARSGKAHTRDREPCIWDMRYPIEGGGGARGIF